MSMQEKTGAELKLSPPLTQSVGMLIVKERAGFLHDSILGCAVIVTTAIPRLAMTDKSQMLVNPDYIRSIPLKQVGWVRIHEGMHDKLDHSRRFLAYCLAHALMSTDPKIMKLWNLATDACINETIVIKGGELPSDCVTPDTLRQPRMLTAEQRMDLLMKKSGAGNGSKSMSQVCEALGVAENDMPCCGSAAGNPVEGEETVGEAHARTGVEQHGARESFAAKARNGREPGTTSAEMDLLLDLLAVKHVPWQTLLRQSVRSLVGMTTGMRDLTFRNPSPLQAAIGFGVGCPIFPGFYSPTPRILVAEDTSGSMGGRDGQMALGTLKNILASIPGASVTYVSCDTVVGQAKDVKAISGIKSARKGGGGTDFRPIFTFAEKRRPAVDVLVVLTDGYGPAPEVAPSGFKTIWASTGKFPVEWGTHIKIEQA